MVTPLWALNTIKICAHRKSGRKFTKIFYGMLLHKTPNHTQFCGDWLKNAGDIRDRKFVLPEKNGPKFTKKI